MRYIDIVILLIIMLIITFLIYDIFIINKKIESFEDWDYNKLGPIKFVDKEDPSIVLGYLPKGQGPGGQLSTQQNETIARNGLSITTIRIPRGTAGEKGDKGDKGDQGTEGPVGPAGKTFTGEKGDPGTPAPRKGEPGGCIDGEPAPECVACTPCSDGRDADLCQPGDKGDQGDPGDPCPPAPEKGEDGACEDGRDADPCIQCTPCSNGTNAPRCQCEYRQCPDIKCSGIATITQINGNKLDISANVEINNNLKLNNGYRICIGDPLQGGACITTELIDRINSRIPS